ncbi:MAG: hypothetical protein Q7R44_00105, partial [bacterium]|nr:hypothetical protein [bacterium]
ENTSNPTSTPTSVPLPEGTLKVWLLSQQFTPPSGRQALIKFGWDATSGNVSYNIYTRRASDKNWEQQQSGLRGPSTTLSLKGNEDYYVKAQGCIDKIGNCTDSSELFLPRIKEQNAGTTNSAPSTSKITPTQSTTVINTNSSDKKVEELNNKVTDLEKKLEESKQKQSYLEQRVTDLVNFIKHLFPFFK